MKSHAVLVPGRAPRGWLTSLLLLALLALACAGPASGGLRISELLAENDGGLRDADGDTPDWIELVNDSPAAVNLAGWHLTDTATNLVKWTFPATNLASGGLLIVFASGKDRAIPGGELHANFQLDSGGGWLALVQPDGTTIAHALAYPRQRVNVAFGPARQTLTTTLLTAGAAARVFVPSDGALGLAWTLPAFDDSAWAASNAPVGFSVGIATNALLPLDFGERALDPAATTLAGFLPFIINSNVSATAFQTQATVRVFGGFTVTVSNTAPFGYDDRLRATPANSGGFTESLLLRDFIFSTDTVGTSGLDVTIAGLTPNVPHRLTVWSYDSSSSGNRVSDWSANGVTVTNGYTFNGAVLPTNSGQYQFTFDSVPDGLGRILLSARRNASSTSLSVFLNALQISLVTTGSAASGLASLMYSNRPSAYLRIPFNVADPSALSTLTLRLRYDDGFAAYVNGRLVAARNAPVAPEWSSSATAAHSAALAEDIAIPLTSGLLVAGVNVLALHGLNVSADDPDFTLAPELLAQQVIELGGRYFAPPTPSTNNAAGYTGLVADTRFSVDRGFHDAQFSLSITCATAGAEIRFTTNGSAPSPSNGAIFTAPIAITGQSFVRAAAFKAGFVPSDIDTHSYLFLRDVLRQSNNIPNYPTTWQASYAADYAMDSNIVNHPVYGGATLSNSLRSIKTLCVVSDQNGLWHSTTGIYPNPTSLGAAWERAASVELIASNSHTEFATTCKIQVHGNASRDNVRTPKHSFGLSFNSDYGPTKLRYDWFGGGVDAHDGIVLRSCGFVDGWSGRYADNATYTSSETGETFRGLRYRPENTCYLRDVWVKDAFGAMGWSASRSAYVHLYLNGLYWGLYEPSEHLDASWFALRHGGSEGAWDVLVGEDNNGPPVIVDGSGNDWTNVLNLVNTGIASEAAYQAVAQLVDLDNLIDYMMIHIVAESEDWPRHNWFAAHRRATNGVPGTKFFFTVWDQELTLDRLVRRNRIDAGNGGGGAGELYSPARVYARLRNWPEFRVRFGDRLHRHLFNGGALTPSNNVARLLEQAALLRSALIGESARWGDARRTAVPAGQVGTGQTFTRDEWWQPEIDKLATNFFHKLTADNVARFRAGSLYPSVGAPSFSQFGGAVSNGFALVITHTNAAGVSYFTTDGADPRAYGTAAIAGTAQSYSEPIAINAPTLVRSRVLSAGQWSALVEATFYPPQDLSRLVVTEIMFNPPPAAGLADGDAFEFLELKNTGTNTLLLGGLSFSSAIFYSFPLDATLAPGAFWLLVRDAAQFTNQYPGVTFQGIYAGRLANNGEVVTLALPGGAKLLSVDYRDTPPWPLAADGHGFSLVPRSANPALNSDNGQDWRASAFTGGSPGTDDPVPTMPTVLVNELSANPILPAPDRVELFNPGPGEVNIGGWFLTDDAGAPKKFRIADATMIPAGGYVVFDETQFNPTPGTNNSFAFGGRGDEVFLFSGDAQTNLTGSSHGFVFEATPPGASLGRHVNSVGEEDFVAQTASTFGSVNSAPVIGPIVLNEVHYHPDAAGDEFIELANLTATAIPLFDPAAPTNTWRLSGLGYIFPTNVSLPGNGLLLIVATNPVVFRAKYGVASGVAILGPYAGALQDSGERLQLQRPGPPETNGAPYYTVDLVRYNDRAPWPSAADGTGASLQRKAASAYGNEPLNWLAAAPTPGRSNAGPDTDGDGVPDDWELAHGTDPLVPDAFDDADGDGFTNLQEFQSGTDPQSPASFLNVDGIALGGGVTIQFLAISNRSYSVLYKNALDAPTWTKFSDIAASPTNRVVPVSDATCCPTNRFYRLVTPAAP